MFDFIKKLYGQGHIYAVAECDDGSIARVKAPFIGDPDTLDESEWIRSVKNEIWFKHKKNVVKVSDIRLS